MNKTSFEQKLKKMDYKQLQETEQKLLSEIKKSQQKISSQNDKLETLKNKSRKARNHMLYQVGGEVFKIMGYQGENFTGWTNFNYEAWKQYCKKNAQGIKNYIDSFVTEEPKQQQNTQPKPTKQYDHNTVVQ